MSRPYFTLIVKRDDLWCPEFGDYDHSVVVDESMEYSDDEKTRVIASGDSQPDIDAAVKALNGGWSPRVDGETR